MVLLVNLLSVQAGVFKLISAEKNNAIEISLKKKIYYAVTFKD
jgi:hypothetical protein